MTPEIEKFETQAQALLSAFQAGDAEAINRAHQHLPQVKYGSRAAAAAFPLTLREAQTVIAREQGLKSWGALHLQIKLREKDYGAALEQFKRAVYAADAKKLSEILTAQPALRSTLDDPHFDFGSTALIIAKQNLAVVDVLLAHGANINAKSQWCAGDFHILEGCSAETARQLIQRGAGITVHAAAEQGWLDWLETAYANDKSIVNRRGGDGKTPLHYTTQAEVMDWLLARGADIEARDLDHASTPLQWLLAEGKLEAARHLIARGAQVDIFAAVRLGEMDLVQRALAEHPAAIRARVNGLHYELTPPADGSHQYVYAFSGAGLSPHQVALHYGYEEIFAYLLEQSPPPARLLAYCAQGAAEQARRLSAASPGLVAALPEADQRQLLHAAWTNNVAAVKLMAELGFDLHVRDDDALTALHWAAFHGYAAVIAVLLEVDPAPPLDWLNNYGGTPLSTALFGRQHTWRTGGDYPASFKLLVEAGSEVRPEWRTGDETIDAILRAGLSSSA